MKPARSTALLCTLFLPALLACRARGAAALEKPSLLAPAGEPEASEPPPTLRAPRALDDDGIFYVLGPDPAHPRVRYLDGQVAANESCMIQLGNKLCRKIPPVYVNGQPLGFC